MGERWRCAKLAGSAHAAAAIILATNACSSTQSPSGGAPAATCGLEETKRDDGNCVPPGVAPAMCGAGFVADGHAGCDAVLPRESCADGSMAIPGDSACHAVGVPPPPTCARSQMAAPGESACHDVGDCDAGAWGGAPVDASTQYVDASYNGATSDGSAARPWRTVQAGVDAASAGAVVAIARGSYRESVSVSAHAVKLWGECPARVEIFSSGGGAALSFTDSLASGSEVHQLAVVSDGRGVLIAHSAVAIDRVWIHDTADHALEATGELTLTRGLVEHSRHSGIYVHGGKGTIDGVVVRDIEGRQNDLLFGNGIYAGDGAAVTVRASLVERARESGIIAARSTLDVDHAVVRAMNPSDADQKFGWGVSCENTSKISLRASRIEDTFEVGLRLATCEALVEDTLVRTTRARATDGALGVGIDVNLFQPSAAPTHATIRGALVERNRTAGIRALGSTLTLESSVVRDTQSQTLDKHFGQGMQVGMYGMPARRASLTLRGSLVERNRSSGISVSGSDASMESALVRDNAASDDKGTQGYGVVIEDDVARAQKSSASVTACVIRDNRDAGVMIFGSDVTLDASVVASTHEDANDPTRARGQSVAVQTDDGSPRRASLTLRDSLLADSHQSGIFAWASDVTIERSAVTDTGASVDGALGDGISANAGTTVSIESSRIANAARAGIAAFDSTVTLRKTALVCTSIALDGEAQSSSSEYAFDLGSRDANVCTCEGAAAPCQVLSSSLSAPKPIPPSAR